MKKRVIPILLAVAGLMTAIAPASTATDLTDIGYVDQSAFASLPMFASVRQQLQTYQRQLSGQYTAAMRNARTAADKQRVQNDFNQRYAQEQQILAGPAFERVQLAIASVASTKKLAVVVDKRIVIYGGQDVTPDVVRLLRSSQTIMPLGTAPPPSPIGYIDPAAFANSPQAKAANDQMSAFVTQQQHIYGPQISKAKDGTQKQQLVTAYQNAIQAEQTKLIKPVVDHEQAVAGQVAQRKGLLLIIDHSDLLYGGTDITSDVQNALAKS
jgi:outer membrane protein